eukprot:4290135-Lingulodinium_polyedra.AAC.1
MLPGILRDKGITGEPSDPALAAQEWDALPGSSAFQAKGKKVSLTRWFGWVEAAESQDALWHTKLLVLAFLGLQMGWLTKAK